MSEPDAPGDEECPGCAVCDGVAPGIDALLVVTTADLEELETKRREG